MANAARTHVSLSAARLAELTARLHSFEQYRYPASEAYNDELDEDFIDSPFVIDITAKLMYIPGMIASSSITSSERSAESLAGPARPARIPGLAPSSMPFAYPRRSFGRGFEVEALRRAALEERAAEEARVTWEMELAGKILFHRARGMSEATLQAKFGREMVRRVLDSATKQTAPMA